VRAGRLAAALAAVTALTALTALTACGSSGPTGAPTQAEIRAVLAHHAAALRAGSAARFLADVDTARADAPFRSRQAALVDDISDVPLAAWNYTLAAPVTDRAVAAAAARRYGAPATVVRVTLSFELAGVDTLPDRHDLWWSFVRRAGKVLLAGDDDVANAGGASWRGPWDFGPVVVAKGEHSLVLGHIENATRLASFADAVDAAVPVVRRVWGSSAPAAVAAYAPATEDEFHALVGDGTLRTDVAAEAISSGTDPGSGRPYGQRLVLDPGADATLSAVGARIVAAHEITHLATAAVTSPTAPRWVVEGFAEYVGEIAGGQPVKVAAAELGADVAHGRVPQSLPTDAAFAAGAAGQPQAYQQAWLACRLIAARAGEAGLVRFYTLAAAPGVAPDTAVAAALRQVLHATVAAFTADWRTYVKDQLA
jgi:hypothetical protein